VQTNLQEIDRKFRRALRVRTSDGRGWITSRDVKNDNMYLQEVPPPNVDQLRDSSQKAKLTQQNSGSSGSGSISDSSKAADAPAAPDVSPKIYSGELVKKKLSSDFLAKDSFMVRDTLLYSVGVLLMFCCCLLLSKHLTPPTFYYLVRG
jgi:hypothetical protein